MGKQLSIHGRDKNGNLDSERYNPNPQEPKLPSTARGLRRKELGRGVKNPNRPSKKGNIKK